MVNGGLVLVVASWCWIVHPARMMGTSCVEEVSAALACISHVDVLLLIHLHLLNKKGLGLSCFQIKKIFTLNPFFGFGRF